jgi:glycosyltransferase involved in cell wall biosynthesis
MPDLALAPVAVVIAAYDEEEAIGGVLDEIPATACGLAVDTIVVDDGSRDGTAEEAERHGAHVVRLGTNQGQGAAFRIGYRVAREAGARYIVTLDADGEWNPADVPSVLEPVVAGEADLVIGSRVLGHSDGTDAVRRAGVAVFATTVRLLTGVPVTDTSSGLRAMRADLTAAIRLEQPQYQTAELLIGAISRGYRVAERPTGHPPRAAGHTKKGPSLP